MGVNKVILVGNVGKDPEIKYLENGTPYARLPLATGDSYKDKDGQKIERTEWHNLVFWSGLAQVVEKWVKKGDPLYIEGSIRTTASEKDGQKRYFTDIVVREMQMLGSKKSSESGNFERPVPEEPWRGTNNSTPTTQVQNSTTDFSQNSADDFVPEGEDDLPF